LPVVDLGHVLRVPRRALEELIGAALTDDDGRTVAQASMAAESTATKSRPRDSRTGRTRTRPDLPPSQLNLLDSRPPTT
jgi:hypothetical protein